MKPTNVQQRCSEVVKFVLLLCSPPNAVGQESPFMLFSWYYLVGLAYTHTHTHTQSPHCKCPVWSVSFPVMLCVFCSIWLSFVPKVVHSSHPMALIPNLRCLGSHFFLFSLAFAEWQQFRNAHVLLILSIQSIVLVKLWHSTELLPQSFLQVSGSESFQMCCLWFLMATICPYDFMIRQCEII